MPTVAVVIIGDEILAGKFADENGPWLIGRLRALGAKLARIAVVSDRVGDIAREVRYSAARHELVITTGGVGPTHDDRTLEAVARAFDVELELRDELVALLDAYGLPRNEAALRMARVPRGAELLSSGPRSYPLLQVHNVFVFPGVPALVRSKFEQVAERFAGPEVHTARLHTAQRETEIAHFLGEAQIAHPGVSIGSYPRRGAEGHHVIVTLESTDSDALTSCVDTLRTRLDLLPEAPGGASDAAP